MGLPFFWVADLSEVFRDSDTPNYSDVGDIASSIAYFLDHDVLCLVESRHRRGHRLGPMELCFDLLLRTPNGQCFFYSLRRYSRDAAARGQLHDYVMQEIQKSMTDYLVEHNLDPTRVGIITGKIILKYFLIERQGGADGLAAAADSD
jgi:hypothetical protein